MDSPHQASNIEPPVRVLVVDDEADTLDLARMLLEPRGYEVATALDGREGLAKAQSGTFDLGKRRSLEYLDALDPADEIRSVR